MERYKVNGVSVAKYTPTEQTEKAPIIMVHGGNHAAWCWDPWAKYLAQQGYEVHALDWYNHGESDHLSEEEFIHRGMVEVAEQELTHVANNLQKKPILIGHSMGGMSVAWYASKNKVRRLVLVAPVMSTAAGAPPLPIPVDPTQPVAPFPYEQAKGLFFTTMPEEQAHAFYDKLEPESPQAVLEVINWSIDVELDKIKAPVMVIDGDQDQIIPLGPLGRYAELLGTELKLIPDLGHSDVLLKEPGWETGVGMVKEWLDKKHAKDSDD